MIREVAHHKYSHYFYITNLIISISIFSLFLHQYSHYFYINILISSIFLHQYSHYFYINILIISTGLKEHVLPVIRQFV